LEIHPLIYEQGSIYYVRGNENHSLELYFIDEYTINRLVRYKIPRSIAIRVLLLHNGNVKLALKDEAYGLLLGSK
jgi:hypothetical protein